MGLVQVLQPDLDTGHAAVQSKDEALKTYRDLKLRDIWLGEILSGYGNSLSSTGRMDEAAKHLEEALTVARELGNQTLIAQTQRFQAINAFHQGNNAAAASLADQAAQAARKTSDKGLMLQTSAFAEFIAASTQPTRAVATRLASVAQQAQILGLRALAVEASITRAQTLLRAGDRAGARQEIDRALGRADALGLKLLLAKGHFTRAEILAAERDAQARNGYTTALRLLNELRGEDGNQNVLKRADLNAIYAACERGAKGG